MKSKQVTQVEPDAPEIGSNDELVDVATGNDGSFIVDRSTHESVRFSESQGTINAKSIVIEQSVVGRDVFARSVLSAAELKDCLFDHADLASITWIDARIVRVKFQECRLTGADLRLCEIRDVHFDQCKMPDAILSESHLKQVRFDRCQLKNLDLAGATIESVALHHCEVEQLRLDGARISMLDLRGSRVDGLSLDVESLRGIVIDPLQAPALAQALGVRVLDRQD
ncbi:MAG: pentapeptide repeat-containing protein [Phycisphaerales bacterium]|nr:pentapeptide repeat-containing protein [Phycisphaerales bacterium]